ncbi:hypothetical protein V9T40_010926 [Parthenolecanium corni]|uniref:Lachesin n=1 Tax=Parthenolecanium corni TaxID=536013 RepID=A0AAN9T532_9HEMI
MAVLLTITCEIPITSSLVLRAREESYNGNVLFFLKVDRKQMGAYLCIASNDVPPAVSKRIILTVNFPPDIRVPNQLLGAPLYTDVDLECFVEAYPYAVANWQKGGSNKDILFNG